MNRMDCVRSFLSGRNRKGTKGHSSPAVTLFTIGATTARDGLTVTEMA